jgi:hypothetical protein
MRGGDEARPVADTFAVQVPRIAGRAPGHEDVIFGQRVAEPTRSRSSRVIGMRRAGDRWTQPRTAASSRLRRSPIRGGEPHRGKWGALACGRGRIGGESHRGSTCLRSWPDRGRAHRGRWGALACGRGRIEVAVRPIIGHDGLVRDSDVLGRHPATPSSNLARWHHHARRGWTRRCLAAGSGKHYLWSSSREVPGLRVEGFAIGARTEVSFEATPVEFYPVPGSCADHGWVLLWCYR